MRMALGSARGAEQLCRFSIVRTYTETGKPQQPVGTTVFQLNQTISDPGPNIQYIINKFRAPWS